MFYSCCCLYNIQRLPEGGYRPRCPNFELAKNPYYIKSGDVIDTNAIYLSKSKNDIRQRILPKYIEMIEDSEEMKSDTVYGFYRFFSNGRASVAKRPAKSAGHFPRLSRRSPTVIICFNRQVKYVRRGITYLLPLVRCKLMKSLLLMHSR